jgi:signal transduction histidine kinase
LHFGISLFSRDEELVTLFAEAVAEVGAEFTLTAGLPAPVRPRSDLCIWDYDPEKPSLPQWIRPSDWRKYLFVVEQQYIASLRAVSGFANLNALLKPVTSVTLRSFFVGYSLHHRQQDVEARGCSNTLRSERDQLLQIVMQPDCRLQNVFQERSNFVARSTHDVRSSLTAIGGYCELLLEGTVEPLTSRQREIVERMRQSTKRLRCAADAMFRLSVCQKTNVKLRLQKADGRECVRRVLQDLSGVLESKQISVIADVAPSPEGLLFEQSEIEQVLVNLIENACKFSANGGTVEIRGYPLFWERRSGHSMLRRGLQDRRVQQIEAAKAFRFDICDSGPRIPAFDADRIFEEFAAYSGGQDRSGAGLSLASCKMILAHHGGRVWAESSATGAVFSFVLPLSQADMLVCSRENGSDQPRVAG